MINIIAAIDKNRGLGYNNNLLCYLPDDLKNFKKLTNGNIVIMGRKTFESLPVKPLKNRINVVLTNDETFENEGVFVEHSLEHVLIKYKNLQKDVFIIGGSSIYKQFMPYADMVYLTEIDYGFSDVDVYFPEMKMSEWILVSEIHHPKDDKHDYPFSIKTYKRKR